MSSRNMSAFLDAFWPNLTSTLIGIILGVPVALTLNALVLRRQRKLQTADRHRQVKDSIDVLVAACLYNVGVLRTMQEQAEAGRVMRSPDLRITTWEVIFPTLCAIVSDPELLQILSHHWLRLKRIQALSDEIFAREIAKSLPSIEDEFVTLEFWRVLHENAYVLAEHATEAIAMLERSNISFRMDASALRRLMHFLVWV